MASIEPESEIVLAKSFSETITASTIIGGFLSPFLLFFADSSAFEKTLYPINPNKAITNNEIVIVLIFMVTKALVATKLTFTN